MEDVEDVHTPMSRIRDSLPRERGEETGAGDVIRDTIRVRVDEQR